MNTGLACITLQIQFYFQSSPEHSGIHIYAFMFPITFIFFCTKICIAVSSKYEGWSEGTQGQA